MVMGKVVFEMASQNTFEESKESVSKESNGG